MYSTDVYYFIPRQDVVLYFGNSPRRYQIVYAKNLKLHKGVDNRIQFRFLNQEQKPVDISDKEITCRLLSYDGHSVLLQKALTEVLPLTGIAELQLGSDDLTDIDPQYCFYSLEIPVNSFDLPVFVDSEAGARGKLQIVDSVLPDFIPSQEITIPSHTQPNGSGNVTFYSSTYNTGDAFNMTIQAQYTTFTGNVLIQGSTTGTEWYDINTVEEYANSTTTVGYNVQGFHPYIKLKFDSTDGTVDKLLVR